MIASTRQLEDNEPAESHQSPAPPALGKERPIPRPSFSQLDDGHEWRGTLRGLVVFSAACDFSLPVLIWATSGPGEWAIAFPFAALGCTLAQGCVLAAALAWGDGPFLQRLSYHWATAGVLFCGWLVGMVLFARTEQFQEIVPAVGLSVPLVSIAAQFPLWAVRHFFGWRVVREGSLPLPIEPPLTIRDLMFATLVVAAALGLARLGPIPEKVRWIVWTFAFTVASVISAIAMLPAGALLLRNRPLSRCLLYGSLYAGSLVGIFWLAVFVAWWRAPQFLMSLTEYVALTSLMLSFAATLMTAAAAARARGYQLVWGRRQGAATRFGPG